MVTVDDEVELAELDQFDGRLGTVGHDAGDLTPSVGELPVAQPEVHVEVARPRYCAHDLYHRHLAVAFAHHLAAAERGQRLIQGH